MREWQPRVSCLASAAEAMSVATHTRFALSRSAVEAQAPIDASSASRSSIARSSALAWRDMPSAEPAIARTRSPVTPASRDGTAIEVQEFLVVDLAADEGRVMADVFIVPGHVGREVRADREELAEVLVELVQGLVKLP